MNSQIVLVAVVAVVVVMAGITVSVYDQDNEPPAPQEELVFVEGYSVTVLTDKQEYDLGDTIHYSIVNTGTVEASFWNIFYGFYIADLYGNHIGGGAGVDEIYHLPPGGRVDDTWVISYYGDLAPPGPYVIGIDGAESEPFTITHDNPAFYEPASVDGYSVIVLTDKQEYKRGEKVRWAIENIGTVEASFETFHRVIMVEDASGDFVSGVIGDRKLSLDPGERVNGVWLPHEFDGELLPAGTYVLNARKFQSEPFTIIQNEPALPEPYFVSKYSVTVLTDKQEYKSGETIRYSIINTGNKQAGFNDQYYGFRVEDLHGDVVTRPPNALGSSALWSGDYVNGTWDQSDFVGTLIPAGTYVITANVGKSEPFTITNDTHIAQDTPVPEERYPIVVYTDKREYQIGDIVYYTIKNIDSTAVPFSNTIYGFSVRDIHGNYIASLPVEPTTGWLQPNKGPRGDWSSYDIPPGMYVIVAGGYSSKPFILHHDYPAIIPGPK